MRHSHLLALAVTASAALAQADTITTVNGDIIHGTIQRLRNGKVAIETDFAGTLRIPREKIKHVEYDPREGTLFARVDVEDKAKEEVRLGRDAEGNTVLIPVDEKRKALALSDVATLWPSGTDDPDYPPIKRWAFSLSFGITGNAGNTKDFTASAYADAVRTGENTTLKIYGSYNKTRSDHATTAEQYIAGLDFEHRPTDVVSWYARDEIQHNRFSDYFVYNVAAIGYGHYLINHTAPGGRTTKLRARLGLSHIHTEHYTKSAGGGRLTENDIGLDLGLLFQHNFKCGLGWQTEFTYTPMIDDFADGTLVHETRLTYTLRQLRRINRHLTDIALEAGMRNEYKTQPDPGYCNTDTAWYIRLKKTW